MTQVVRELGEKPENKKCSNQLFQWRMLRRLAREDIKMFSDAMVRNDQEQIEYPACCYVKNAEHASEEGQALAAQAQVS